MKDNTLSEQLTELKEVIIQYLNARIELGKAVILGKMAKTGTYFLSVMMGLIVIASFLLLLLLAFSFWYAKVYGDLSIGLLIAAGAYLLIGILVIVFVRPVFSNNIIRNVGKVLFEEDTDK